MGENPANAFKISQLYKVTEQMKELVRRAANVGATKDLLHALKEIRRHLVNQPLVWGEPLYDTKLQPGVVCHGTAQPLHVHFVVYPEQQIVCILDIKANPTHPLADPS